MNSAPIETLVNTDIAENAPLPPEIDYLAGRYAVRDLSLAEQGRSQIRLAEQQMPGLMALRQEFGPRAPLAGARITGSLHMTVQTAVLIETLIALGASVRWASCNIFSTQDEAAAAVVVGPEGSLDNPTGPAVFAWKGESLDAYWWCTWQALCWPQSSASGAAGGGDGIGHKGGGQAAISGPDLVVDDGADASTLLAAGAEFEALGEASPAYQALAGSLEGQVVRALLSRAAVETPGVWTRLGNAVKGVSEETTTGVHRLTELADQGRLSFPVIDVNNSVTKSKFDNIYGIRHSLPDGLDRATDVLIGGKVAVVAGYGDVGKGAAQALRGQGARVIVSEIDPICALQAAMDGFQVARIEDVVAAGDFFITATGNCGVITAQNMSLMKDKAVVGNIGHFDNEVDIAGLGAYPGVRRSRVKDQVDEWVFPDGHSVLVLSEGRLLNLGNATGHPSFVMSCSFTNQVLAQIDLWTAQPGQYRPGVYRLPKALDEKVARLHLPALGVALTELTPAQARFLGVPMDGPFKPEYYRY
ncbi:MAG: adenosylhomocysteinase [Bifidobacteriaceae bacterium]|jgi:adenosylhomocysteinase|nr:adenosylhomocysteinase [Bifidobacteriaceae bacterium]